MSADERTTLLPNGYGHGNGYCNDNHIVHVPKDLDEYEPILSAIDFSSSLSLEELLPYKDDPWWLTVRRMLFCSFWITLLLTFFWACTLSYLEMGTCNIRVASGADNATFSTTVVDLVSTVGLIGSTKMTS